VQLVRTDWEPKSCFKVAVVQAASVGFDAGASLEKLADLSAEAAAKGARLAVFPEAFIGGYPKGLDFGATIGNRTPAGKDDFVRYWRGAVEVPGPAVDFIGEVARKNRMQLVVGVIERDRGTLYCCVLFFDANGAFLGKHRKLMPTASERLVWGFGDGSTLPVFETELGRVGAVVCWENYMPLLRAAMYSKGIELYCAPTADARDSWAPTVQHVAIEGRCFVLSANQFSRRKDFPATYASIFGDDPETIVSRGGSCIVDPFGQFLVAPQFEGEAVLVAEIDPDQIPRGKFDLDSVGHYARPDIFRLLVDEGEKTPVSFVAAQEPYLKYGPEFPRLSENGTAARNPSLPASSQVLRLP
jgi:nitrilase